mgnify:CR=1 FL=1
MPWWDLGASRARVTGEWDTDGDSERREMSSAANDGIISSAAIIQGLLSAGATGQEALVGVLALTVVGTLTSFGGQFGEASAERNNQLAIIASEKHRVETLPQEEFAELVELYRAKGLSQELSHAVATELHAKDALAAQLDAEFAIDEPPPRSWPAKFAARTAAAFLVGSIGPLLLFIAMPHMIRGEITLVVVTISLAFSGWIGARSEHGNPLASIARTLAIGLITLGISTLAGSLVTF